MAEKETGGKRCELMLDVPGVVCSLDQAVDFGGLSASLPSITLSFCMVSLRLHATVLDVMNNIWHCKSESI